MYSIYALTDPRTNGIRYIGMSKNAWRRYAMHLLIPSKTTPDKNAWIEELRKLDLSPLLTILETIETEEEASERETYWIQYHLQNNVPLTNIVKTGKARPSSSKRITPGTRTANHELLKIGEVAQELGLAPFTVRKYLRNGFIPAIKLEEGGWLVKASDVDAYLEKRTYHKPEEMK